MRCWARLLRKKKFDKRFANFIRNCELREPQKGETKESGKLQLKLKSLIMAQIERWRQALDMQVER